MLRSATSQSAKGTYELKSTYQKQYNPYYYHYTKIEKTKAEEEQLKRKSPASEKFFPPPVPPQFQPNFAQIRNLLDSDILIKILTCILKRANSQSKAYSDEHLVRALHLIGLALIEEKADKESNNEVKPVKFVEKVQKQKQNECLKTHLTQLISKISAEPYKLLASWTLDLFYKISISASKEDESKSPTSSLGARSSLATEEEMDKQQLSEKRKNQSKLKAEQRRLKILAQMSEMQKTFIKQNKDFFETTPSEAQTSPTVQKIETR